jgi:hypothetical protein
MCFSFFQFSNFSAQLSFFEKALSSGLIIAPRIFQPFLTVARQRAALLAAFSKNQIIFLSQNFNSVKHGSIIDHLYQFFLLFRFQFSLILYLFSISSEVILKEAYIQISRQAEPNIGEFCEKAYQQANTLLTKVTLSLSA